MNETKFYYIVGAALIVLLVLVVYVGSKVQNLELAVGDLDDRLSGVESAIGLTAETSYGGDDQYSANVYDSAYGGGYDYNPDYYDPGYYEYPPDYYYDYGY